MPTQPGVIARLVQVRQGELKQVLLSGGCFFLLLFGYFLLRPIREAMGVQRSMRDLQWLFLVTCGVSLIITLAFGGVVARFDRKRFITIAYRAVIVCLLGFIAAQQLLSGDQLVHSGYVFYVWLSVVNLFVMSVFWALMADVWSLEQGKRLFATIGIGGTLGAFLGSNFVWWLAEEIPVWVQIGVSIIAFELAVQCVRALDRTEAKQQSHVFNATSGQHHADDDLEDRGRWMDGVRAMCKSPYLLGIGGYIALLAIANTMIYFTQANLVANASDELGERIALFAQLDMWTQLATLLVQLFVTGHIIRKLGVGVALALLPVVTCVGFASLAWVSRIDGVEGWQIFAVFATFNAVHRATRYAVVRPARETLFAIVGRDEKFKAKPIVDVFVYRGGDVAGTGLVALLGLGLMGMAMAAAPLAVLWGVLAFLLAATQHKRGRAIDARNEVELSTHSTPPGGALGQTGSTT